MSELDRRIDELAKEKLAALERGRVARSRAVDQEAKRRAAKDTLQAQVADAMRADAREVAVRLTDARHTPTFALSAKQAGHSGWDTYKARLGFQRRRWVSVPDEWRISRLAWLVSFQYTQHWHEEGSVLEETRTRDLVRNHFGIALDEVGDLWKFSVVQPRWSRELNVAITPRTLLSHLPAADGDLVAHSGLIETYSV